MPLVQLAGRRFWLAAGIAIGVGMSLRIRHNVRLATERVRATCRRLSPSAQYQRRRRELRTALDAGRREMLQREAELRAQFDPPQFEPTQFEPTQFDPPQFEPTQLDPIQFVPTQFEPTQLDPTQFVPTQPSS